MSSSENLRGQIIKKFTLRLKITEIYVKRKYKLMRNKLEKWTFQSESFWVLGIHY